MPYGRYIESGTGLTKYGYYEFASEGDGGGCLAAPILLCYLIIRFFWLLFLPIFVLLVSAVIYPLSDAIVAGSVYCGYKLIIAAADTRLGIPINFGPKSAQGVLALSLIGLCVWTFAVRIDMKAGRFRPYRWVRHVFRLAFFGYITANIAFVKWYGRPEHTRGTPYKTTFEVFLSRVGNPVFIAGLVAGVILIHILFVYRKEDRRQWYKRMRVDLKE